MKTFTLPFAGIFALLCWAAPSLSAQNSGSDKGEVVIIQKVENEDGTVTTVKKRIRNGDNIKTIVNGLQDTDGGNVELHVISDGNAEVIEAPDAKDGEAIFLFRRAKAGSEEEMEMEGMKHELENMKIILHDEGQQYNYNYDFKWNQSGDEQDGHDAQLQPEQAVKAFLGIYPGQAEDGVGVRVNGVVEGTGAEAAGLKKGDVIRSIGGLETNGDYGLRGALTRLQPGTTATVSLLRDGQPMQLPVMLGEKEYTRWVLSEQRDPCKVFIGVYVGGQASGGRGVQVTGIIGKTPAESAGMQSGDVILSMDGVAVNNNDELLTERNKHEPGQEFTMDILRNGQQLKVDTRFLVCSNEEPLQEEPVIVEEEPAQQPDDPTPALELPENSLELMDFKAYPNPAFSYVNVQFQAEAVPTVIQLADASGRIVFQRQLNNFDGYYNEELDLRDVAPGTLTLTIRQGDKLIAKQLVLLNRA